MRYLTAGEVIELHQLIIQQAGTGAFLSDVAALESAAAQPRQAFAGVDLYPTLPTKAAALGFSLIQNHPFSDGNKRVGHAAMAAFLRLNGSGLKAPVEEAERVILGVASGTVTREALVQWIEKRMHQ